MKKNHYIVVVGETVEALSEAVSTKIDEGYGPAGNFTVGHQGFLYQAMLILDTSGQMAATVMLKAQAIAEQEMDKQEQDVHISN